MDVATLGIKIEKSEAVQLITTLDKVAVAGDKAEKSTQRLSRRMGLAEIEARKMDAAMAAQSSTLGRLKGVLAGAQPVLAAFGVTLGAAAVGMAVRELVELTNTYTGLSNKLRLVTTDAENRAAVERELFAVSQRTRTEMEGNVMLYSSLARSTKALGLSQRDLVSITETVAGALAVGGASASEQASSIRQLSQAFASGVLRGDEFNSMAENAPRLQELLAKSLGVSVGQLRAMAEQGLLTSEVLAKAFLDGGATVRGEVEGMALSISGAMTQIKNAVLVYVGASDDAHGASRSIAEALSGLAENIPTLLNWWGKLIDVMLMYWKVASAVGTATKNLFTGNWSANGAVMADLRSEWDKLLNGPGAGAGAVGTKHGIASGAGQTAAEIARAARERKEAEREAERKRKQEEREAARAEKHAEDYADDLKKIWDRGMEDIVASTDRGFRAMLDSVASVSRKMLERMAQEGQTNIRLAGVRDAALGASAGIGAGYAIGGMTTSRPIGAITGALGGAGAGFLAAGPIGAATGALAGFVTGIMGAGSAAREAAQRMQDLRASIALTIEGIKATIAGDDIGVAVARAKAEFDALRKAAMEAFPGGDVYREMARHARGLESVAFWLNLASEADAARAAKLAEINDLERQRIEQITKEASASREAYRAGLNLVQGYKAQAAIFAAMAPRATAGGAITPGTYAGAGAIPGRSSSMSGDLTIPLVIDGQVMGRAILRDFRRRLARGDSELQSLFVS